MRPTDKVLEEEVFLHLFRCATDGQSFGRSFFHLVSGATDGQSFGRRSFFCMYLVVRPTDKVLDEDFFFFLHLFSGATYGQGFGRRSFFAFI